MPKIIVEKAKLPTLWLDTSIIIKLAKITKGEALQQIEVERCKKLETLILELVSAGKLLCPQSDQEEEYAAERLEDEVHRKFVQVSFGISLRHRQGILDQMVITAMGSNIRAAEEIYLPSRYFFHGDPVRELEERRSERFHVFVGPNNNPEMIRRRAEAKAEINDQWESLRLELTSKGRKFEDQLGAELRGYWDGMEQLVRRFQSGISSRQASFWDFMGAQGPLMYRKIWNDLGGKPADWEGVREFFHSTHFNVLPIPDISCHLGADLLTGNESIASGDQMDIDLLSVALPIAHYVVADRRMVLRMKKHKLDEKYGAQIFSMSTIEDLFPLLEKLR
jgi:hypothetical protein